MDVCNLQRISFLFKFKNKPSAHQNTLKTTELPAHVNGYLLLLFEFVHSLHTGQGHTHVWQSEVLVIGPTMYW